MNETPLEPWGKGTINTRRDTAIHGYKQSIRRVFGFPFASMGYQVIFQLWTICPRLEQGTTTIHRRDSSNTL